MEAEPLRSSLAALRPAFTAFLALFFGLAGCAGIGGPAAPSESDRAAWAEVRATAQRSPNEGIPALRAFLDQRPGSPLADDAAVTLARLLIQRGDEPAALQQLIWTVRRHPNGDRADSARLLLAGIQHARGHTESAWREASRIRLRNLPPPERPEAARLLAQLADERGDPVTALRWLAELRAGAPAGELQDLDTEMEALIARMEPRELARAADQLGRDFPAAKVRLRQAELFLAAGDSDAAEKALERVRALPLAPDEAERLARIEARGRVFQLSDDAVVRLPSPAQIEPPVVVDPARLAGTLGVALPLSGPFASLGEESLEGILLATGMFDSRGVRQSGLRLLVRDTLGTAEGAAAAVRELAEVEELLAILGPLGGAEAEAAALVAEQQGVPLLALTRREEVAMDRPHVFRLALPPRLEAELVAETAMNRLGAKRFAILHPDDGYGQRMRSYFWDAVERRGGEVVGVAGYPADATDFAGPIRSLVGFDFLSRAQKNALSRREKLLAQAKRSGRQRAAELRAEAAALTGPGGGPLPPYVDFDALFIPDAHDNVVLIAPQLAFHQVRGVRLLGTSGWNHPELVSIARRHVNGAVFTGTVHRDSQVPHLAEFARRFEATFGHPVDSFAAEAFDATGLLLHQLARRRDSRESLRRGLLDAGVGSGVSGVYSVGPDGNVDKRPHLLGVESGRVFSLDQRGTPPRVPHAPASRGR